MGAETPEWGRIGDSLEALRREVAGLGERVAALEASARDGLAAAVPAQPPVAAPSDGIDEETIAVISAAIAAFLGKKPHIRQIRLLRSDAWSQQGRVTVHASHALPVHHSQESPR